MNRTMKIVILCSKIEDTHFPTEIDGITYKSLTEFVHLISHQFSLPFSAGETSQNRLTITYNCSFSSSGCKARLVFNQIQKFDSEHYFSFNSDSSEFIHSNHPVDRRFIQAHRNCLSESQVNDIQFQTQLGVLPGRIRTNVEAECGSNIFYNIRRKVIHAQKNEDLDKLIQMLQDGEEKTIKVNKPNDILERITVIDNEILNSNYAHDIVVIDDTAMTNLYGLPLETMVVIDQEDHTQLLGYSILPNKSTTSFLNFFNDYIELGGSQFRIIVVDHLQAQINALEKAFPNSYIVFCLVHIRRDLLLYFSSDDEIIIGFERAKAFPSYSYKYLEYLKRRIIQMDHSDKGHRCILSLVNNYQHWLPICLVQIGMYANWNSSRIEGFFGLFRCNYGHERGKITTVIKSLNNFCAVLKTQSYASYNQTFIRYSQLPLIPRNQIMKYGKLILSLLDNEFTSFSVGSKMNEPCVWCHLRMQNNNLAIPCRHTIKTGYLINIEKINQRYLRIQKDYQPLINSVTITNEKVTTEKTRNGFLARIDPFVNLYGKNAQIDDILDTTLNNLEHLGVRSNPGMPPTISQQGHQFLYPSKNVLCGRQKTKRVYKCTICNSTKHTKKTCPFNPDNKKSKLYGF